MNKDEMKMIEEMEMAIGNALGLTYEGERLPFTIHTRNHLAKELVNAGYRKVAEDEIVVKKYQLNETLTSTLESGRRMGYAQAKEAHEDAFSEGFDAGKKAVAQYYLDVAYHRITDLKEDIDSAVKAIKDIAKEDGINLW